MIRITLRLRFTLFSVVKYGIDLRTYDFIANYYDVRCNKSTTDRSRCYGRAGVIKKAIGGSAWESNPPGTVLTPHTGFEVREPHQPAAHFR